MRLPDKEARIAAGIAEKHIHSHNPAMWNGRGIVPKGFSDAFASYKVSENCAIDVRFVMDNSGAYHKCELWHCGVIAEQLSGYGVDSQQNLTYTLLALIEGLRQYEGEELVSEVPEGSKAAPAGRYLLVATQDEHLSIKVFGSLSAAQKRLKDDFVELVRAIGNDDLDEVLEDFAKGGSGEAEDFGIKRMSAWVRLTSDNYDWQIVFLPDGMMDGTLFDDMSKEEMR